MFYIEFFIYYLGLVNFVAFMAFVIDKIKAKSNWERISEKTLLSLAVIGGSPGALLSMLLCWHKVNKKKFYLGIPFILFVQLAILIFVYVNY